MGRMIEGPQMFRDGDFQALPVPGRLLFIAMITLADDEGRGQDDPRVWKQMVFPLDAVTTEEICRWRDLIGALRLGAKPPMVMFYSLDDWGPLYQVTRWRRHQNIRNPRPSVYPPPPDWRQAADPRRRGPAPAAATARQLALLEALAVERGMKVQDAVQQCAVPEGPLTARDADLIIKTLLRLSAVVSTPLARASDAICTCIDRGDFAAARVATERCSSKLWGGVVVRVLRHVGADPDLAYREAGENTVRILTPAEMLAEVRQRLEDR